MGEGKPITIMLYFRYVVTATPAHFSFAAILSPRSRHASPICWLVQDSGEPAMVASPGTAAGAFFLDEEGRGKHR